MIHSCWEYINIPSGTSVTVKRSIKDDSEVGIRHFHGSHKGTPHVTNFAWKIPSKYCLHDIILINYLWHPSRKSQELIISLSLSVSVSVSLCLSLSPCLSVSLSLSLSVIFICIYISSLIFFYNLYSISTCFSVYWCPFQHGLYECTCTQHTVAHYILR